MDEKTIEQRLVKKARALGALCYKFTSPGTIGVPDRMIVCPNGTVMFVEVKRPGEKLRPNQVARVKQLENHHVQVFVVDSVEGVDGLVKRIELTGMPWCSWAAV